MKTEKNKIILMVSLCFFSYAACYLGRNILSAFSPQLLSENAFSSSQIGLLSGVLLLIYGFGQLISGFIGNKIKPKYMVFTGLTISGIIVMIFPFVKVFPVSVLCMILIGFACSMLWGPISKKVGENTTQKTGQIAMSVLTVASIFGMMLTYVAAFIGTKTKSWKLSFLYTGLFIVLNAVIWFVLEKFTPQNDSNIKTPAQNHTEKIENGQKIITASFIFMTIVTMLNGIIRNAVSFWIPAFLSDGVGIDVSNTAIISMISPLVNTAVTFLSLYALKYTRGDEKLMCLLLFAISTVLFVIVFFARTVLPVLAVISLFAANALMMGACNMIFSIYILTFTKSGKLSSITGFLDFSSYISASAASYAFSFILEYASWNGVVLFWIISTALGFLAAAAAIKASKC